MRGSIARASARVSETRRDADADVDARSDGCEEIENRATEPYVVYGARDAERDRFARRARGELERAPGAVDPDGNETARFFRFFIIGHARGANKAAAARKTCGRNATSVARAHRARRRRER